MSQKEDNITGFEIVIQTKELAYALSFANSIVEKRNVLSELSNVKLSAVEGSLELGATDMDLYLCQTIGAQVISPGETTVAVQTLSDIVKKIPDAEIRIKQTAEGNIELIGSNRSFNLLTLPANRFPLPDDVASDNGIKIACREFADIIERTGISMSSEETRYNLNGIYMHVKDGELVGAATDGHRLSVSSGAAESKELPSDFGVIVPRKTVLELLKIVKDPKNVKSDIEIFPGNNKIKYRCNNLTLISKLIDGSFPDYEVFIPAGNNNILRVNRLLLSGAVDRAAVVTVDKFRAIKIAVNAEGVLVTAHGETKGASSELLLYSKEKDNLCIFEGEDITIGFNPKYLSDVLDTVKDDEIELLFGNPTAPVIVKNAARPKDSFVIMPVNV